MKLSDKIKRIQDIERHYYLLIIQEILDDSEYDDLNVDTKLKLGSMVSKHKNLANRIEG